MQNLLPTLIIGVQSFIESNNNPNIATIRNDSLHVLNGMIIVHLFSMWDVHLGKSYIDRYFRPEEKKIFYAFKHIRIVAAHNIDGNRKGNRQNQDRMDHAEKLDDIMSSKSPISGILIETYKIDLSQSNAALDCRQFMHDMALKLACGRISVGDLHGQARVVGGGTTNIM